MDTREKIVPVEQLGERLRDGSNWLAVTGTFDPLTLPHAERLARLNTAGKSVLAVVEPTPKSLLPVEARAILVAALKTVQMVVIGGMEVLADYPQLEIISDDAGERQRSADFAHHVKGRQSAR